MYRSSHGELDRLGLLALCRRLRADTTDAESLLWRLLRARRLVGVKFRRQHQFGAYILDFYSHEAKLVIELDGDGHAQPEQQMRDAERTAFLASHGLTVLRFSNRDVLQETEAVLTRIWNHVSTHPHPVPLPGGEGK
ncbi:endonuclease domain-containing protein [Archangium lansingense]|uniref:endonuclease domain-containing protein n=1 Tax=Archangium lansingense TaxID=2995310 RepID=UPI003B82B5BE